MTPSGSIARERKREVHAGSPPSPAVTPPLPERGIGCGANSKAPLWRGEVPTGTGGRVRALRTLMFWRYAHYRARDMERYAFEICPLTGARYATCGREICALPCARYVARSATRYAPSRVREMRPAVARYVARSATRYAPCVREIPPTKSKNGIEKKRRMCYNGSVILLKGEFI